MISAGQKDLFRQWLALEMAQRRARRDATDLEHVEIDAGEQRAGLAVSPQAGCR